MFFRAFAGQVLVLLAAMSFAGTAAAQTFTRLVNGKGLSAYIQSGQLVAKPAPNGLQTAEWEILPHEAVSPMAENPNARSGGTTLFAIRNRGTKDYIIRTVFVGEVIMSNNHIREPWEISPAFPGSPLYLIRSASTNDYLQVKDGQIGVGPLVASDSATYWYIDGQAIVQAQAQSSALRSAYKKQLAEEKAQAQRKAAQEEYEAEQFRDKDEPPPPAPTHMRGATILTGSVSDFQRKDKENAKPKRDVYDVSIDFCHSDLSDTGTANELIVTLSGVDGVVGTQRLNGTGNCSVFGAPVSADAKLKFETFLDVSAISVETTGGDALFIDEIEIWKGSSKIAWYGRENQGGWCLSTDPNDHLGGWEKAVKGCTRKMSASGRN